MAQLGPTSLPQALRRRGRVRARDGHGRPGARRHGGPRPGRAPAGVPMGVRAVLALLLWPLQALVRAQERQEPGRQEEPGRARRREDESVAGTHARAMHRG